MADPCECVKPTDFRLVAKCQENSKIIPSDVADCFGCFHFVDNIVRGHLKLGMLTVVADKLVNSECS